MLLSLNWLREFVPYTGTAQELGDRLTMLGLELEDITRPYAAIAEMVVGRVLTCARHPESDHLSVCTVDVGEGAALDIVCGAPNVAAGQLVPVAKVGTVMPGGLEIKKAKLRGAPSHGMICSERELNLSEEHNGILVLEKGTPGQRVVDALGLDDEILEIGITPNRADALSVIGLAREAALAFGLPLTLPKVELVEHGTDWTADCPVSIADPDLCRLYQLRLIEGITVAPSPAAMRYRLHAVGVRPISNVVDVTNYILMELGQPLHAFDRDRLEGTGIRVVPAQGGEKLVTLDGQERALVAGDILIHDGVKPVGLAGVMGGANSEMTATSRSVVLEAAVFRPASIRKTARRLGLSSEASYRFERGVDQAGNTYAMNRAAALIASLSGGTVRTGVSRSEPRPWQAQRTVFRHRRALSLLGLQDADMPADFCTTTLTRLGCTLQPEATPHCWQVTTPSWRQDLTREADLIEELARVYGMDRLPETLPTVARDLARCGEPEGRYAFLRRIRQWASGLGLNEVINYSFVGQTDLDHLNLPGEERIAILNPLTEDQNVLRTALAPGLLQNVRTNIAHGATGVRLFEVASTFHADATSETTARENARLGFALYGTLHDTQWGWGEQDAGYTDLRGLVAHCASFLHLTGQVQLQAELVTEHPYLRPCVRFAIGDVVIGVGGRLAPKLADAYHARKAIWLADLDLDVLEQLHRSAKVQFAGLPVYPPIRRDITVITPRTLSVAAVATAISDMDVALLENISLIDLFEPADRDERNATFRLTFRHAERTLKDAEADKERDRIVAELVRTLGVRI